MFRKEEIKKKTYFWIASLWLWYHVKFDNLEIKAIFSITSFGTLYKNIDELYMERNKRYD